MRRISTKERLIREIKKNERLNALLLKQQADMDYIAMMCYVELEDAETEGNEDEQIP